MCFSSEPKAPDAIGSPSGLIPPNVPLAKAACMRFRLRLPSQSPYHTMEGIRRPESLVFIFIEHSHCTTFLIMQALLLQIPIPIAMFDSIQKDDY